MPNKIISYTRKRDASCIFFGVIAQVSEKVQFPSIRVRVKVLECNILIYYIESV